MNRTWYHVLFVAVVAAVILVLWKAPPVTTPRLPRDADHADRRQYERCPSCHGAGSEKPMPKGGTHAHFVEGGGVRGDYVKCYLCHRTRDN
ncbi:MAG: hypothetical protein HZB55_06530 [Deltaproteobacteria bacterium]|nr:hypothetical protein [Deltaproteobacteria bacterium]